VASGEVENCGLLEHSSKIQSLRHIQVNLGRAKLIEIRALMANHPTAEDRRLGIKLSAPPESIQAAKEEQKKREDKRKLITKSLEAAANDLKALSNVVSMHKNVVNVVLSFLLGAIKHISPLAVLSWAIARVGELGGLPLWQGTLLCLSWLIIYNLLGLLGVPFHDAGYRKFLLFEGYIGKPSDGIEPLFPTVSRIEDEFYTHLGISKPIVVSLDDLIPAFHATATIALTMIAMLFLPLDGAVIPYALIFAFVIVCSQTARLWQWRRLLRQRYPERSLFSLTVITYLELVTGQFGSLESESDENGAEDHEDTKLGEE